MADIYPPREDSEFLASFVRKLAHGKVLDVGTGSGIQAFAAAERGEVTSVIAVDANPAAIAHVNEEARRRETDGTLARGKLTAIESDMFTRLGNDVFDTVVCNPPYLPDDPRIKDMALDGGPTGHEWSARFLAEAAAHIAPNGQLLFLFSNLTNRQRVDSELRRLGYAHEELGQAVMGMFERLYVYRIWRPA